MAIPPLSLYLQLALIALPDCLLAQPATSPRILNALESAAIERREAESRKDDPAAARARAWEAALRKAAPAATPLDGDAVLSALRGSVTLERAGQTAPPSTGLLVRDGDVLRAAKESWLELRFHDGSGLAAGPETELRLLQAPRGVPLQAVLSLQRGSLHWDSPPVAQSSVRVMRPSGLALLRAGSCDVLSEEDGVAAIRAYSGEFTVSGRAQPAPPAAMRWRTFLYP